MEQLNRIEIRGTVGNVKLQAFTENRVARFSVVTNYAYRDKEGAPVIESAWHTVLAREGRSVQNLDKIAKGSKVFVQGKMRYQKYIGSDGGEKFAAEIVADKVVLLDDSESLRYEM